MSQPTPRLSSLFKLEYPQSVGVFPTYDEAQKVVDFLADARFPVENLCIVGTDLRSIERVLGRRSWATVIGAGVQSGVSTGLMITLLFWLFQPNQNILLLALYALMIGIVVGILMAVLGHWMGQGKRDFTSVSQTVATKYEVLAEHKVVGHARELIASMPGGRAAQFNPVPPNPAAAPPPGYGQAPHGQGYGQQNPGGYGQPGYPQMPAGQFPPPPGGYAPGYGPYGPGAYGPGPYLPAPEASGLGYPTEPVPPPDAETPAQPDNAGSDEPRPGGS